MNPVCACSVTQSCLTLWDPMDCSPPGSSVHGILQAKTLEWVASPFSRGSSHPRDRTQGSCIASGFFTSWATRKPLMKPCLHTKVLSSTLVIMMVFNQQYLYSLKCTSTHVILWPSSSQEWREWSSGVTKCLPSGSTRSWLFLEKRKPCSCVLVSKDKSWTPPHIHTHCHTTTDTPSRSSSNLKS